ncbi:V-set and immunoglobulin domain-containing protein 10-like isoform X2 [Anguilla anguilla]|uniref:V-set and immunoglobulin domain-containing protein 10-like isoform X2 n=1 Tax=Anguilla anguilla TaxID=7936 RepID=UPI0015AE0E3E|nr:V-set and immunoglobulin domain-containing protein 10-like isoform X2 [Anguilla anguilla]
MPLHCTLKRTCWGILLTFLIGGVVDCVLQISRISPSVVNATVGDNVTLAVSYSGVSNPKVEWMTVGEEVIATWQFGSSAKPETSPNFGALDIDNGSLVFHNVQLNYSDAYVVRMSKVGQTPATTSFTLSVFDIFKNVSITAVPKIIAEGIKNFSLQYSTTQGEATSVEWFFNDKKIKNGTPYIIGSKNLTVTNPNRTHTGRYTLKLSNPINNVTIDKNITVFYGPEQPILTVSPQKNAFELGDTLSLSCKAGGDPAPTASWKFNGVVLTGQQGGILNLTNVKTNQSGVYTCVLENKGTGDRLEKNFTINIYERPLGSPLCSVGGTGSGDLQYRCKWPGGNPQATLSFPALNASRSGSGDFNLTAAATPTLSGKEIICIGRHPLAPQNCSVTARGPAELLPVFAVALDDNGTVVVSITCASASVPLANVTWSRGGQVITSGGRYQISPNTTVLSIVDPVLDTSNLGIYICDATNPLGRAESNVHVLGPTILDSSLSSNSDGTMVTLSWQTPPTSIVTAFQVQMTGPALTPSSGSSRRRKRATDDFRTVQQLAATARSTTLGLLDPKSSYQFRVVPVAGQTAGQPSQEHHAGPGGLSEAAIAGIAAGVPCAILLLVLLILLIVCCACKRRRRETRYPVSRAVDKAVVTQPNLNAPHKLLTGGMKSLGPPDYNLHQAPSERSSTLPYEVSPPAVRMATTV